MKQLVTFIVVIMCFLSCKQKEVEIPADVIPYDTMVQVVTDIQQSEVAIMFLKNKGMSNKPKPEAMYNYVFDTYKISAEDFDRSFLFYSSELEVMEKLYGDVIEELRKRQVEIESN
ncbi:MAG: DUF4296 domain-containing protein [Bacteroidia bacterium]|nr:DUF4296 domain-containing protein [Bacteroidia bacterium]NNC85643.1 DUF4296 domain-containing protein [Bacteroidia bacterium]NNM16352.1 DUF4296 domain-containing protein [Bacteroidia bacterium]